MAAQVAQMKKKTETVATSERYSQSQKFVGATAKLDLYLRQQTDGTYKVYALMAKKGAEKKSRGAVSALPNKTAAIAKFDEVVEECLKAGWTKVTMSGRAKSAFDAIPAAE